MEMLLRAINTVVCTFQEEGGEVYTLQTFNIRLAYSNIKTPELFTRNIGNRDATTTVGLNVFWVTKGLVNKRFF